MEIHNRLLITGVAGFIGFYVAKEFLRQNFIVLGVDNLNEYYDVNLKLARLDSLKRQPGFSFVKGDIVDPSFVEFIFQKYQPSIVINLAAQAGVRYSIENPQAYIDSNIVGFFNILEACRHSGDVGCNRVKHLIFASSSSVYGINRKVPYSVEDKVDNPVSLYAATKKSNELMAHAYSKLYGIPVTGLRFFTVYGPMGRPDMAYFSFTNKMVKGERIQIYNYGDMYRDFTYIDDIVKGIVTVTAKIPQVNEMGVQYKVYNIGNNKPESLMYFVNTLETCLLDAGIINRPAEKEFLPMQKGDVYQTYADIDDLVRDTGFKPSTSLQEGLRNFVLWYKDYYLCG